MNLFPILMRALKIGKIADGGMPPTYETTHLFPIPLTSRVEQT